MPLRTSPDLDLITATDLPKPATVPSAYVSTSQNLQSLRDPLILQLIPSLGGLSRMHYWRKQSQEPTP
jgi:hypothetical protein